MVNLKLAFVEWFFGNTSQVIQNPTPKFKQNFIISEKPGYLSEKLKNKNIKNECVGTMSFWFLQIT